MKKSLLLLLIVVLIGVAAGIWWLPKNKVQKPWATNFAECVALGNPLMESYPRQCRSGDITFTEDIGDQLNKMD